MVLDHKLNGAAPDLFTEQPDGQAVSPELHLHRIFSRQHPGQGRIFFGSRHVLDASLLVRGVGGLES